MQSTRILVAGQLHKLSNRPSACSLICHRRINLISSDSVSFQKECAMGRLLQTRNNYYVTHLICLRCLNISSSPSCQNEKAKPQQKADIVESRDKRHGEVTISKKVAQAGKDFTYIGIIVVGVAVTGLMFYVVGRELFSGQSPSGVYAKALRACRNNEELTCALGTPLKGYGEMTRRRRRRHVSHIEFERDGIPHMRMKFYVEGPDGKATAHVEVKKNESGYYEYRYLFVETDEYPKRTFVIEDNR